MNQKLFVDRVREIIETAHQKFPDLSGYDDEKVVVEFFDKGTRAGEYQLLRGVHYLRFNRSLIESNPDELLKDTVPHEVAHYIHRRLILENLIPRSWDQPHGKMWKHICRELGGSGKRCHNMKGYKRARKSVQYLYEVAGNEYWIGKTRHNRMLKETQAYRDPHGNRITKENFTGETRVLE